MFKIEDLFERRDVFATKLELIMQSEKYTKARLCKEACISRPTLDKLLACEITNKSTFEKHVEKILNCLKITPDNILGNIVNRNARIKRFKKILHLTDENMSEAIGISIDRFKEIEAGEDATIAELRDIALMCGTSVRGILGTYYFNPPVNTLAYFVDDKEISGFWGHIGILLSSQKEYKWYPITMKTYKDMHRVLRQDYAVVPCMNNVVLFLNMSEIDDVVLLDEACDQPTFANWDPGVSEGEVPLVIYDALEDYDSEYEEDNLSEMSEKFLNSIKQIIKEKNWDDNDIWAMTRQTNIYFSRGNCMNVDIVYDDYQEITNVITETYEFGDLELMTKRPAFTTYQEEVVYLNIENVAMMELPLVMVENEICRQLEEMMDEEWDE